MTDSLWDNNIIQYDISKYDWPAFWLEESKKIFPQIQTLETIHKVLSPTEINLLVSELVKVSKTDIFRDMIDNFYAELLEGINDLPYMIQRTFNIRIVIPNQAKVGRLLAFHKDEWTGNGDGIKNVWTPITKSYDSNSLQVISIEDSNEIDTKCKQEEWEFDKIQEECLNKSKSLSVDPGSCLLFHTKNIHGNINNETDITRVSMDGRILVKGEEHHKKMPGGYFRFVGEKSKTNNFDSSETWISYAGWNSYYSSQLPIHMQRLVINQFCEQNNIVINDYQFESESLNWYPTLTKFTLDKNINGIVLCSVYCLPDNPFKRHRLIQNAIENNIKIAFANEDFVLENKEDFSLVNNWFTFLGDISLDTM